MNNGGSAGASHLQDFIHSRHHFAAAAGSIEAVVRVPHIAYDYCSALWIPLRALLQLLPTSVGLLNGASRCQFVVSGMHRRMRCENHENNGGSDRFHVRIRRDNAIEVKPSPVLLCYCVSVSSVRVGSLRSSSASARWGSIQTNSSASSFNATTPETRFAVKLNNRKCAEA